MFWRLGFAQTSPLEQLLESEDFTLQQVLEENEVIQECKQLNKKLIDFLAAPEQVKALIDYVVDEPPEDGGDKEKFIYPYKASEVLSSDLNAVYDTLFANEEVVNKFFTFLSSAESPLNPIRAGYFTKVVSTLLSRRPDARVLCRSCCCTSAPTARWSSSSRWCRRWRRLRLFRRRISGGCTTSTWSLCSWGSWTSRLTQKCRRMPLWRWWGL